MKLHKYAFGAIVAGIVSAAGVAAAQVAVFDGSVLAEVTFLQNIANASRQILGTISGNTLNINQALGAFGVNSIVNAGSGLLTVNNNLASNMSSLLQSATNPLSVLPSSLRSYGQSIAAPLPTDWTNPTQVLPYATNINYLPNAPTQSQMVQQLQMRAALARQDNLEAYTAAANALASTSHQTDQNAQNAKLIASASDIRGDLGAGNIIMIQQLQLLSSMQTLLAEQIRAEAMQAIARDPAVSQTQIANGSGP